MFFRAQVGDVIRVDSHHLKANLDHFLVLLLLEDDVKRTEVVKGHKVVRVLALVGESLIPGLVRLRRDYVVSLGSGTGEHSVQAGHYQHWQVQPNHFIVKLVLADGLE